MHHVNLFLLDYAPSESHPGGHVKSSGRQRWSLVITQPMPFNPQRREFCSQGFATLSPFRFKSMIALVTHHRKLHTQLAQIFDVRNQMPMTQNIHHPDVRNVENFLACEANRYARLQRASFLNLIPPGAAYRAAAS